MTRRGFLQSAAALATVPESSFYWIEFDLLHKSKTIAWPDSGRSISFGSLLKPFLALAYSSTHDRFPVVTCHGTRDRCWLPHGHGEQNILHAIANSCNCYFLHLVSLTDRAALDSVCLRYGLSAPPRSVNDDSLVGLGAAWSNTPLAVVEAFSQLTDQTVLQAMAQCAQVGTARNIGLQCYAKTGTAPCSHVPRAAGDGFVIALYPVGLPRRAVLFEQHGTTGAEACKSVKSKIDFH